MLKLYTKAQARLAQLRSDEAGAAAEYGLIIGLVAVAIIVGLVALGGALGGLFEDVGDRIGDVTVG